MKRIVIACGGTGGHFYPGYVLAATLRARGWETLFLLRTQDPAAAVLSMEDLPFVEVDLHGMPRGISAVWGLPGFAWRVVRSLWLTRNVLRAFRPQCVVGMGGYLTFPAVLAARWLCIPAVVHESNAILGLTNRICLPFVSKVALGLPLAEPPHGPIPSALTGTPVRPALFQLPDPKLAREKLGLAPEGLTILIFGGSQGARAVNRIAAQALRNLAAKHPSIQCLHLSGPKEEETVRAAYASAPFRCVVIGYTQEMHLAYAAADIVVCRSGASTLAELAAVRKPAILIPFPSAAANHQEANARVLERAGAARCLLESALTPDSLAAALLEMISSGAGPGSRRRQMAESYRLLELPAPGDTPATLADIVERRAAGSL